MIAVKSVSIDCVNAELQVSQNPKRTISHGWGTDGHRWRKMNLCILSVLIGAPSVANPLSSPLWNCSVGVFFFADSRLRVRVA